MLERGNSDKVVAVGLLTQRDLDVLGVGFTRHFPAPNDDIFADLLKQLDSVPAIEAGDKS